jgi:hypothetical protein
MAHHIYLGGAVGDGVVFKPKVNLGAAARSARL